MHLRSTNILSFITFWWGIIKKCLESYQNKKGHLKSFRTGYWWLYKIESKRIPYLHHTCINYYHTKSGVDLLSMELVKNPNTGISKWELAFLRASFLPQDGVYTKAQPILVNTFIVYFSNIWMFLAYIFRKHRIKFSGVKS